MCSQFMKRMENYEGDLADIVRATASTADGGGAAIPNWQFPGNPFVSSEDFGDPFTYMMKDPLMHNNIDSSSSGFFFNPNINQEKGSLNLGDHDDQIKRPPNIFSRMLQVSPSAKPPVPGPPAAAAAKGGSLLSPHINRSLVDSPGLQISSPRNTGIKRRKSQAKKVVCIPAPAPANSRSTGEVVPSDLWAWRKYGQKPIKGSPYPRGYYRCSSSKGCSARKQVERSQTDPNMLVITYTSEHNHPWPTQRNALAGSTRSQPSKNTTPSSKNSSPNSQTQKPKNPSDQEHKESSTGVKEEMITDQDFDNQLEMDEADRVEEGFPQTYKPTLADSIHSEDSFFADLGEIEVDPLNLLFTQGFSSDDPGRESNDLDPFCFYDWATSNVAATVVSSGECKRDS